MGTEFGQGLEWNSAQILDWYVLDYPVHQGIKALVRDLNRLYHATPALYQHEFEWQGFEWIDCHDAEQSVVSFLRRSGRDLVVVIINFTPVPRFAYRIGVPEACIYREVFNSDSRYYGGSDLGNGARQPVAEPIPWMGRPHSIELTLPPLAGLVLAPGSAL
jgi:1,4-alpha-glucan branching enzyme